MVAGEGGRQEVSGEELRMLAEKAEQASIDVARVRNRVQEIVNGVDRRGWDAGAFDDQWARTRFGLTGLSEQLSSNHAELLTRADEADRLNTRNASALNLVGPDGAASDDPISLAASQLPSNSTASGRNTQPSDAASLVQALLDGLTLDQAVQLLTLLGVADPYGMLGVVSSTQRATPGAFEEARDNVLGFLSRVKDDPFGEAKRDEDAIGQAKDAFLGNYPIEVDALKGLLGMLAAAPNAAPPVTCSDGRMRLSQDAVDILNGQKPLDLDLTQPDFTRQNLGLLAAEAAARCGQIEATQQVFETRDGVIAVVATASPKDLWDELSQMLNHDQQAPRGNRIVEPPPDAPVEGSGARLAAGVVEADGSSPSAALTRADEIRDWAAQLDTKRTPLGDAEGLYEVAQTGPDNYRIIGGGTKVWADGIRAEDAHLLDAKYIGTPGRSPFIEGSACPEVIRKKVLAQMEDEFRRYAAVLGDSSNPVTSLEIITNDERAVTYFEVLLQKYHIKGQVVVRP